MQAQAGDQLEVHYTGRLEEGAIIIQETICKIAIFFQKIQFFYFFFMFCSCTNGRERKGRFSIPVGTRDTHSSFSLELVRYNTFKFQLGAGQGQTFKFQLGAGQVQHSLSGYERSAACVQSCFQSGTTWSFKLRQPDTSQSSWLQLFRYQLSGSCLVTSKSIMLQLVRWMLIHMFHPGNFVITITGIIQLSRLYVNH